MWAVALIRWLALVAGGISFGLAAAVLFAWLRKMGRARQLPHHIIRMAIAHAGLALAGCVWIGLRIDEGSRHLLLGTPYLLVVFVVSDAGLIGLLWDEYMRMFQSKNMLTKDEVMGLKREADAVHVELRERIEALEKRNP